jgi:hypothetical protein
MNALRPAAVSWQDGHRELSAFRAGSEFIPAR